MQRIFRIYIVIIIIAFIFLLFPETGNKLIVINEDHGPSATDSIGLVLIIVCWVCMLITSLKRRKTIALTLNRKIIIACIAAIAAGSLWLITTLSANSNHSWIPGMLLAVAGYTILFCAAFRK